MGSKNAFAYLASPAVVAASAAKGYIAVCEDGATTHTTGFRGSLRYGGVVQGPPEYEASGASLGASITCHDPPRAEAPVCCPTCCAIVLLRFRQIKHRVCRPASRSLTGFLPHCMEAFSSVDKIILTRMAYIR